MSDTEGPSSAPVTRRPMPRWQKLLLAMSVVLMLIGGATHGMSWAKSRGTTAQAPPAPAASEQPAAPTTPPGSSRSFLPNTSPPPSPTTHVAAEPAAVDERVAAWAPATFRLGFSFFVGFSIAYALRTFFKVSALALGVIFLAFFGLQYAGVLNVDWSILEGWHARITTWLATQTAGAKQFITGQLPSAGSAAFGLLVGFKR